MSNINLRKTSEPKLTFKQKAKKVKQDIIDGWNGFYRTLQFLAEIAFGAAAVGVLWMAYQYMRANSSNTFKTTLMVAALVLMGGVALRVVGKYCLNVGKKNEQ